jgi:hypothetical protein
MSEQRTLERSAAAERSEAAEAPKKKTRCPSLMKPVEKTKNTDAGNDHE